jgi:hypothetical protein
LQRADSEHNASELYGDAGALDEFLAEARRQPNRYATDCQIDLATALLADLFAWCLSRGTIELQQGEVSLQISCATVGWIEQCETHRRGFVKRNHASRAAQPILQNRRARICC